MRDGEVGEEAAAVAVEREPIVILVPYGLRLPGVRPRSGGWWQRRGRVRAAVRCAADAYAPLGAGDSGARPVAALAVPPILVSGDAQAAAIVGSIGIAPSGNINPERRFPSMFEPVHGSAPDIAGKGIANPVGAFLAAGMMLDHLGESAASAELIEVVTKLLKNGISTKDLGGTETTESFTQHTLKSI